MLGSYGGSSKVGLAIGSAYAIRNRAEEDLAKGYDFPFLRQKPPDSLIRTGSTCGEQASDVKLGKPLQSVLAIDVHSVVIIAGDSA